MDRDWSPNRDVLVLDYCLYNRLSVIGLFLVFRYERLLRLGLRLRFRLRLKVEVEIEVEVED